MTNTHSTVGQRVAAASAMRRLSHAMVGRHVAPDILEEIEKGAERLIELAEQSPLRNSAIEFMRDAQTVKDIQNGEVSGLTEAAESNGLFGHSIVSGRSNPMSVAVDYTFTEDEAIAKVALGPAFEGAPSMAHGGIIAAIMDETMGAVLPLIGALAFTGKLSLTYRAPTPIGKDLEFRAKLDRRDGRKLYIVCTCTHNGEVLVEAEGLFIALK